ncbi:ankyrin repeat-containing domain protein [Lactarius akahatsu]|uniref:Ankyrin repeat-containing domain protein n=1 Tax=Lactarius akahatsu TaxID=416441 RepID=A0AAD4L963_9AGAM|nr:ankyrin repeat-containing domain protein [Lactarius akahatsu]
MKALFDLYRPHFAAWIGLYDIDAESGRELPSEIPGPLYYSAFFGFSGLTRHIAIKYPQHVNAIGGLYEFPLVAALSRNHFRVAELLLEHGGNVDVRDKRKQTALHKTIDRNDKVAIDTVQFLLEHGADVNVQRDDLWTPLHLAANLGELTLSRMLLERQADVNLRNNDGQAPLHVLSRREASQNEDDDPEIAKLLLERGANVNEKDKDNATPLHLAIYNKRPKIVRVLLDHGANAGVEKDQGENPLQIVLRGNHNAQEDGVGVARLLLEHGAEAYARDKYHVSTSDLACCFGREKIRQVLLGDGGNSKPETNRDQTAFWLWIEDCGVDRNVQDKYETILLHSASYHGKPDMLQILLNHGVNSNAKNHLGKTALHVVSRGKHDSQDGVRVAQLLLESGVDVDAQDMDHDTPLHSASYNGRFEIARVLLDHDAKASAKNDRGETPLHQVSKGEYESQVNGIGIARLLLDRDVDVNAQDMKHVTPLHLASWCGKLEIAKLLLGHATLKNDRVRVLLHVGPKERTVDLNVQTPLHFASFRGHPEIARLLLDHGAKVNAKNDQGETPLHLVSRGEYDSPNDSACVTELSLERGTDANAQDKSDQTSLHAASYDRRLEIARVLVDHRGRAKAEHEQGRNTHQVSQRNFGSQEAGVRIVELLLEHGGDANVQNKNQETPLHVASRCGKLEIIRALLGHAPVKNARSQTLSQTAWRLGLRGSGADVNALTKDNWTPLHSACSWGRLEIARLLLDHGAKANAETDYGETPLHTATNGKYEPQEDGVRIAQLLLERGVDANAQRKDNYTPLHAASYYGRLEIVRLLLVHGAKADTVDNFGYTPLHFVSCGKSKPQDGVQVARLLLECGGNVNGQNKRQQTPLHVASYNGRLEIARLLLDHGGNVNALDDLGDTPLHNVSQGKYDSEETGISLARLLLERGGDVNGRSNEQRTPLHVASYNGKVEIAQLLLGHGAKVRAVDDLGETPLHDVSQGKYDSEEAGVNIAQLLLERDGDVNGQSKRQQTPLHAASKNGRLEIARLLLDHGAKVGAADDLGDTPLHNVSQGKYGSEDAGVGLAKLLLERGGDVNEQSKEQRTPLHSASYNGRLEIARLLLGHGAKVDAVDDLGRTPLHYVSLGTYDSEEAGSGLVRLLLEHGGDVNGKTKNQGTPLHFASYNGRLEIVQLLLDHGAKVDAADDWGETPLHDVSKGEYDYEEAGVDVARVLLKHGADANIRSRSGKTPLDLVSSRRRPKLAQLLEDRVVVNAQSERRGKARVKR